MPIKTEGQEQAHKSRADAEERRILPKRIIRTTFHKLVLVGSMVFLALFAAFLLTWHYVKKTARESIRQAEQGLIEQMVAKYEDYRRNMIKVATSMAYSPTVYSYFFQDSAARVISNEAVSTVFSNTFLLDPAIADIFLYDQDMERIADAGKETEELEALGFLKEWKDEITYSGLFAMPGTNAPCFAMYFPVFDLESETYAEQIGMCVLAVKTQNLEAILSDSIQIPGAELYLLDKGSQILASTNGRGTGHKRSQDTGEGGLGRRRSQPLTIDGWSIVLENQDAGLSQEISKNISFIAAAYLLAAALVSWLLVICYQNLVRPIQEMDGFVRDASSDPGLRIVVKDKNEIGKVEQSLNRMLDSIAQKNEEIQEMKEWAYQTELAKKQLQILVYRNQINPHFLYNTLDCIRAMAILEDLRNIAAITMALSRMFRFAVREENVVTVEEEVSYTKEYARIIDYRFDGKIKIQISMEDSVSTKPILKLMLQPLIENAVFHGLERKVGGGKVEAVIRKAEGGRIRLEVTDDGCGMQEETLKRLRDSLVKEQNEGGIGLSNIYRRLKLFYGDDMAFSIESREGEGTKVIVETAGQIT